jgi:hypothetical protein
MSPSPARQILTQEILNQIKPGEVGLAMLDLDQHSDVFVNNQGQALRFDVSTPEAKAGGEALPVSLDSMEIADLALILDSFADPDFGVVVPIVSLGENVLALPVYFQGRFESNTTIATLVKQHLGG